MAKLERTKSLTIQELEHHAVRARRRFKALVRLVVANKRWLEDVEDEQLSRNVKKNVQLLTRKKGKKSLLTLQTKAIMCKPKEYRTEQEKILLNRVIGGLKCFRKYPEHVKMQLAGVTYFVYFGPGRVIVRQNHEAHALYFIVTGEVIVSITSYDPVIKEEVTINVGTMVAGSMFGEVSLLHDIPRTATITTSTPCELLCLKKEDFDIVLKASVKEQWDEIQKAMSRFTYFDGWDDVAVRECCIYSKIKPYIRDQTILGDGVGIQSSTYFILKGQCKVIEHLLVRVTYNCKGKKIYNIYYPNRKSLSDEEISVILDEKKGSAASLVRERRCSIFTPVSDGGGSGSSINPRKSNVKECKRKSVTLEAKSKSTIFENDEEGDSRRATTESRHTKDNLGGDGSQGSSPRETHQLTRPLFSLKRDTVSTSNTLLPYDVETHFMQVCVFSENGCFGLGENMRRRRVIAASDYCECLLIPRYWLFQHNRGNLWTRIQQYLDTHVPTTQQVFQEFIGQRRWLKFRNDLALSIFRKPPVTDIYNVPYSIRINEDIRYEE